jgi:hypothetical protein
MPSKPTDPLYEQTSTAALLKEAFDGTKELVRIEIELARADVKDETRRSKRAAIAFAFALAATLVGICLLSVALVLALGAAAHVALLVAAGFFLAGLGAALAGYTLLPKAPLGRTRDRLQLDANQFKEHLV